MRLKYFNVSLMKFSLMFAKFYLQILDIEKFKFLKRIFRNHGKGKNCELPGSWSDHRGKRKLFTLLVTN